MRMTSSAFLNKDGRFLLKITGGLCLYAFALLLNGCVTSPPQSKPYSLGYRELGLTTWHGQYLHGRPTISGEIYNMFGFSAAHRNLPFGTLLRVTDLKNKRSVEVKVNDRGPFIDGRVLSLSYAAAKKLDIIETGFAKVELKIIGNAPIFKRLPRLKKEDSGRYFVQVGSFQSEENAQRLKIMLDKIGEHPFVETLRTSTVPIYRVRLGPYLSEEKALSVVLDLHKQVSKDDTLSPIVVTDE